MLMPFGPANARLMIVTECVSYRDLQRKTILDDREFDKMLAEAGIQRNQCFTTAFIRGEVKLQNFEAQVAKSKKEITPAHVPMHDKMVLPCLPNYLAALERDIDLIKPKIILAVGNGALFALTGKWGIGSWRSSILEYTSPGGHTCHVIPTWHPSYIYSVWKDRNTCIHDMRKAGDFANQSKPLQFPAYDFTIEPSFSVAATKIRELSALAAKGPLKLSVDIETRGGHIACIGIAWSELEAICIPLLRATAEPCEAMHYWREEEEAFLHHLLYQLLTHENAQVVGQNFVYDAQYFYRHLHYIPRFARDTMIAQHSMFSNMPKGLDMLSSLHTKYHVYWKDESKDWNPKLGERQLWIYNCKDCCVTYEVDTSQQAAIDAWLPSWPQLRDVHDFQQSLFWPVLETMIRGLRTNNEAKANLSAELAEQIEDRNAYLADIIGYRINIKSPKQMRTFFYTECAQKPVINRKTHSVSCDDTALEKIATREPLLLPIVSKIRELRSLGVFRSTFLEAPVDIDDRMRCQFKVTGTETYRFASSEDAFGSGMNLQNVPTGDEAEGLPNVRSLFLADPGYEFFDIDLDSADLRIVVWESDCTEMKAMFAEGLKPYVEVAKEYYRDPTIDKHHPSYKLFKALCHGTNYLGTPSGLASRIGLLAHEIERIQNWYFGKFPEILKWQNDIKHQVESRRYIENVFGYRCYIFDRIEGTIFNEAVAWIPQSTVACLINRGYRNISQFEPDIQVLLQVHDSLAGQYPASVRDSAIERIRRQCAVPLPYASGDLIIPVGIKTSSVSWGDCQ